MRVDVDVPLRNSLEALRSDRNGVIVGIKGRDIEVATGGGRLRRFRPPG